MPFHKSLLIAVCSSLLLFFLGCASTQTPQQPSVDADPIFTRGVVAADHLLASQAGLEMLQKGGNAVDAAVATSFCLAVVRPYSCGLGGGGFMLIHLAPTDDSPARQLAITYRETSPAAVDRTYYVDLDDPLASQIGPHAVATPGTVAGLLHALETHGTLDRATVLAPAIRAAIDGFAVDAGYVAAARAVLARLDRNPALVDSIGPDRAQWFRQTFLFDGQPEVGRVLRQPQLARTLERIARDGAQAFYAGPIAADIVNACPQIIPYDLAMYEPCVSAPLRGSFQNRTILAMPPPSSGGVAMLQILGLLERRADLIDKKNATSTSPDYIHTMAEAMKHAFADRARFLADDRFTPVPISMLLSDAYLQQRAARINADQTFSPEFYAPPTSLLEDGGTSHLSVVDQWGNAVACTETINLEFGSLTAVPEHGFILNNEMDDFLTIPGRPNAFGLTQSDRNLPQPGKWPLSSMSPTIVLDPNGKVEIVVGASGGPRIISASLQVMLNVIWHNNSARQAVTAPRFHHQWMPNVLQFESDWENQSVFDALQRRGHEITKRDNVGVVQLVRRSPTGIGYSAASDPRKGGQSAGW